VRGDEAGGLRVDQVDVATTLQAVLDLATELPSELGGIRELVRLNPRDICSDD
jgi:hypothetical protein